MRKISNSLFLSIVLMGSLSLSAQNYPDWQFEFFDDAQDEIVVEYSDASGHNQNRYAGPKPPTVDDGLVVQWNFSGYDPQKHEDDWAYEGHSPHAVFNPNDHPTWMNGYVYLHAVVTNTKDHAVVFDFSAPQFDVAFELSQLDWDPTQHAARTGTIDGFGDIYKDLDFCGFTEVSAAFKNKIIRHDRFGNPTTEFQPNTLVKYFGFSLSTNEVGREIPQRNGVTGLAAGQSMLVKWYAMEKPAPGLGKVLAKGVLPEGNLCVPRELVPELYEKCGDGKLNINFFDNCTNSWNTKGRLVFNYFAASKFRLFLYENPMLRIHVGSDKREKFYSLRGKQTRFRN